MKINLAKIKQYCNRNAKKYPYFPMTLVDWKSDATKYLHIARASVRQAEYHKFLTAHHLVDLYIAQCIYHEATKQRDKSIADLYTAVAVLLRQIDEYETKQEEWAKIRAGLTPLKKKGEAQ